MLGLTLESVPLTLHSTTSWDTHWPFGRCDLHKWSPQLKFLTLIPVILFVLVNETAVFMINWHILKNMMNLSTYQNPLWKIWSTKIGQI